MFNSEVGAHAPTFVKRVTADYEISEDLKGSPKWPFAEFRLRGLRLRLLHGLHGLHHHLVREIRLQLSPKALLARACSPCACAFRHRQKSMACFHPTPIASSRAPLQGCRIASCENKPKRFSNARLRLQAPVCLPQATRGILAMQFCHFSVPLVAAVFAAGFPFGASAASLNACLHRHKGRRRFAVGTGGPTTSCQYDTRAGNVVVTFDPTNHNQYASRAKAGYGVVAEDRSGHGRRSSV